VVVSLGLVGPAASFGVLAERSDVGELVAQDGQVFRIGGSPVEPGPCPAVKIEEPANLATT